MAERQPRQHKTIPEVFESYIKDHSSETAGFGVAGFGVSILGDKIGNSYLLEAGSVSVALAAALLVVSWGRLWVKEAIDDAIEVISRQIQKIQGKRE